MLILYKQILLGFGPLTLLCCYFFGRERIAPRGHRRVLNNYIGTTDICRNTTFGGERDCCPRFSTELFPVFVGRQIIAETSHEALGQQNKKQLVDLRGAWSSIIALGRYLRKAR